MVLAARLEAGKGQAQLIDALAQLGDRSWEAWIVGGAQQPDERAYLDGLRDQAGAAGLASRIRFLGQRSDVADLFEAADVYCQPNIAPDSFGLSFIEALSAGLPVVTTRLGAAAEIVDTSCGVLVEPGSLAALRDALGTLIEGTDHRHALQCRRVRACARVLRPAPVDLEAGLRSGAAVARDPAHMTTILFTIAAFVLCLAAANRSLRHGLLALLGVGYVYGILRANFPDTWTYLAFDAGGARSLRRTAMASVDAGAAPQGPRSPSLDRRAHRLAGSVVLPVPQ